MDIYCLKIYLNNIMADEGGAMISSFDGNIVSLPQLIKGGYTKRGFIQQCAMTLFCNTNFDENPKSAKMIADEAVTRAIMLTEILDNKIGFDK